MVELRALGAIDLRRDGREIAAVLTQPRHLALLLYLDIARPYGFHRGDDLVQLLWPDVDSSEARNKLTEAVDGIRREIGDQSVRTRGDDVMLDPVFIRSDVRVLDSAIANTDHMRVVQLYQGTLADGFSVEDAPEFERWLEAERQRIRSDVANSAWSLAEKSRADGRMDDATTFARSAAALTRDDEESIRRLMTFLEDSGDHIGALRAYDEFAIWLSSEMDADPAPDTDALRDKIRDAEPVEEAPVAPPERSSSPAPAPAAPSVAASVPAPKPLPVATAVPSPNEAKQFPQWLPWAAVGVAAAAVLLLFASVFAT